MNTDYLKGWNVHEQQRRAEFMEHMYDRSGRANGLYTGLWQEFCLNEAGPYCRNMWFEQQEAIKQFIEQTNLRQLETMNLEECDNCVEPFIPTFSD